MVLQKFKLFTGFFIIPVLIGYSCSNHNLRKNNNNIIEIKRFERDLFSAGLYHFKDSIVVLQAKYPRFFPLFTNRIIEIGDVSQPDFEERLKDFVSDYTIYNVSKKVDEVFANIDKIEDDLTLAFGNYKKLFPGNKIPEIITCISGFNQSIVVDDSLLVICLDKYLGKDNEFYKMLYPPIPEYSKYTMHPAKIPSDAIIAFITTEYQYDETKDNLLSRMIFEGRAFYVAKRLMETKNDTLFWGYTLKQLDFCKNNEKQMWTFLVEHKYLFNNDKLLIVKYIEQAPFTKEFSSESPGRAAVWIGSQIVSSYMMNNKDVTLPQLMEETDYLKILNLSRYNP